MKWLIRFFFKTVRAILGPILLFINWITTPRGIQRSEEAQSAIDAKTANMALYQFQTCPFCIKVRRQIKRQSLKIELRDARNDPQYRDQLLKEGGQIKVPCLKIVDDKGKSTWLYESNDIIDYLQRHAA